MVSSRIFRSRRAALIWAGGILWTAYDVATSTPRDAPPANATAAAGTGGASDATGAAIDPADLAVLANAGG